MDYTMRSNLFYLSVLKGAARESEADARIWFHLSEKPFSINRLQALSEFLETGISSFSPTTSKTE